MEKSIMRKIKIEKIVLNVGGVGDDLEKGFELLKELTNKKPCKTKSKKRIPSLGVRPGLEIGAMVTLRKDVNDFLKKLLLSIDNVLKKKQIKGKIPKRQIISKQEIIKFMEDNFQTKFIGK
jgi:ribosomal protein L5